jgi:hypothetical protein
MAIINYSPWMDAARYGQGLGETLGRILMQMPQVRAQQRIDLARLPIELQMQRSQLENANALRAYREAEAARIPISA